MDKSELQKAWLTILSILKESGYDFMYQEEIDLIASVIRNELGI